MSVAQAPDDLSTLVSLIERDMTHVVSFFEKLDTTIDQMAEVSSDIKQIITVHEDRLNRQEKTNDDLFEEIKELRVENRLQHERIEKKINNLEKIRWMIIGACAIIGYTLSKVDFVLN